jgi:hypothetical protein
MGFEKIESAPDISQLKKIAVQALAFIGLSTISITFPFASRFDDDIACP